MGFRKDSYCTVFSIEPGKGKFTKVRIAISRKNKMTGQYETDFTGYCMFIGNAHAKAAMLKERDKIMLLDVDVSNRFDKEARREYVDYKVFDFDFVEARNSHPGAPVRDARSFSRPAGNAVVGNEVESDDDLPTPF